MIGRSTVDAMCRTMNSVKAPDWVEVPTSEGRQQVDKTVWGWKHIED
jgi:hypothetical protein